MIILIYLTGFIATYLLIKKVRNKIESNDWSDVILTIALSLFSWIAFVFVFFMSLYHDIFDLPKPHKFL